VCVADVTKRHTDETQETQRRITHETQEEGKARENRKKTRGKKNGGKNPLDVWRRDLRTARPSYGAVYVVYGVDGKKRTGAEQTAPEIV
jgi:hypothetical protein